MTSSPRAGLPSGNRTMPVNRPARWSRTVSSVGPPGTYRAAPPRKPAGASTKSVTAPDCSPLGPDFGSQSNTATPCSSVVHGCCAMGDFDGLDFPGLLGTERLDHDPRYRPARRIDDLDSYGPGTVESESDFPGNGGKSNSGDGGFVR